MRKVLIITDLSQASPRIPGLAKYLIEFNWKPIILTNNVPESLEPTIKIIKIPYLNIVASFKKKLGLDLNKKFQEQIRIPLFLRKQKKSIADRCINFVKEIVLYPDEARNWMPYAIEAADNIFKKEKIDAIISSSSPVTAHIISKELKEKYKVPWIADLRDLWSQNCDYQYSRIRKFFEKKLELKTLKEANALVTVSSIWADELKKLHKRDTVYTITNGFDPDITNIPPFPLTKKFSITYTGTYYSGKRDPLKFFIAIKDLFSRGEVNVDDVEIRFYGPREYWITKEIEKYQLSNITNQYGMVPKDLALQKQRESQILLFLNWEDKKEKGVYAGKIFEYLAARRPILSVGGSGEDVIKELLFQTKAGVYGDTVETIKNHLKKFYLEFKQKGKVDFKGDESKINTYNYREMAKKFAKILNRYEGKS